MIEMENINKVYKMGEVTLEALKEVSLRIGPGEFISIMGPSGSGKSTLLNIIGCLDTPTDGSYFFEEKNVAGLSLDQLSTIRNRKIGFVFQNFNLISYAVFCLKKKEKSTFDVTSTHRLSAVAERLV